MGNKNLKQENNNFCNLNKNIICSNSCCQDKTKKHGFCTTTNFKWANCSACNGESCIKCRPNWILNDEKKCVKLDAIPSLSFNDNTCGTNGKVTLYQTYKKHIPKKIIKQNLGCFPNCVNYEFFDDDRLDNFFKYRIEKNLFNSLKNFAHKADLWRYIQIYETGGIYLDADSLLIKCLDKNIIKEVDAIYLYDKTQHNIHNGFFYSRKNSPIIKNVIDMMIKIGYNIPDYWYNLKLLRAELELAIGDSLSNLRKPFEIRIDKYGWKNLFLTDRNEKYWFGPDGKEFYNLKHNDYPY